MTSKRQRRVQKRRKAQAIAIAQAADASALPDERYRPKRGPGQVFTKELIDMRSGHAKRFRNVAESPLLFAYWKGQLCSPPGSASRIDAQMRLNAGEMFERLWYAAHRSLGRDSTELSVRVSDQLFWTPHREDASRKLSEIADAMERTNFRIVRAFVGESWPARLALIAAGVEFDDKRPFPRIREALDDLVYATGRATRSEHMSSNPTAATQNAISPREVREVA